MERLDSDKKPYGIICNIRLWKYIKPKLQEWKYYPIKGFDEDWSKYPVLVLNEGHKFGNVTNLPSYRDKWGRVLVEDIDTFLIEAAKLMGYTYDGKCILSNLTFLTKDQIEDILDIPRGHLIIPDK